MIRVCKVEELLEGEALRVTDGVPRPISVWNVAGEFYAIDDTCTHQDASLTDGYLEGCAVECPLHASMFDLRTGHPDVPPARTPVRTHAVLVQDGAVYITPDTPVRVLPQLAGAAVSGHLAVVGASLAGISAVRALRGLGYDGAITVIGEELHEPYDRPPLSKEFLAGKQEAPDISLTMPKDDELDVDWRLGVRATGLKVLGEPGTPGAYAVELATGEPLAVDGVVIATGARARELPGEMHGGVLLAGVHTLRTLDDAQRLRAELIPGARLVVCGGGFIGAEIASTAKELGVQVTIVEAAPVPLAVPLGEQLAAELAKAHVAHGVELITGVGVTALNGDEKVGSVVLADGRELPADVVVVGIGSIPNTEWLAGCGVEFAPGVGGVLVDEDGRTNLTGVVATGDIAAGFDPLAGRIVRGEHWTSALQDPNLAAAALLGVEPRQLPPHAAVPYFWSDQYGARLQFAGYRQDGDTVEIVDGDLTPTDDGSLKFVAVYKRGETPVAVLGLGIPKTFTKWRRELVKSRTELMGAHPA